MIINSLSISDILQLCNLWGHLTSVLAPKPSMIIFIKQNETVDVKQ